ncbi:four helix bundle protein [Altibacter sp.]|uniref:four helix bundle protein n=1 Tax=Altibacter sp. TaxID=2024823 RepID=UPI0025C148FB|nr:four helix bundle protein [Altibacter sp.]
MKLEAGSTKLKNTKMNSLLNHLIMKFKFENLVVWQKAMDLGEKLIALSQTFPTKEKYNLTTQICRAADSIALNIAEGSIGQSAKEYKKFMGYSIRSLAEVVTCLHKVKFRKYIKEDEFIKMYDDSYHLMNMMVAFKKKIS